VIIRYVGLITWLASPLWTYYSSITVILLFNIQKSIVGTCEIWRSAEIPFREAIRGW